MEIYNFIICPAPHEADSLLAVLMKTSKARILKVIMLSGIGIGLLKN